MFCFQWIPEQVWEPFFREECVVAKEQEAARPRLWIPSSPGKLKHVQEGFWLQLVKRDIMNFQEGVFILLGRLCSLKEGLLHSGTSYQISASSSERL